MRPVLRFGLALALLATFAADRARASELALPLVASDSKPTLLLAQRTIEREWGPSDDSIYVVHEIPEWRSEGGAMVMSAAIPGLGQAYAGEPLRGLWFALVEVAGWVVTGVHVNRAGDLRDAAAAYAGAPSDSNSTWSFARWEKATSGNPADLEALYAGDPESFYFKIGADSVYQAGWNDPSESRDYFNSLRKISDDRLRVAHASEVVLWINHLVAALDALHVARIHNLPLQRQLGLQLKGGWSHGSPTIVATIERKFW